MTVGCKIPFFLEMGPLWRWALVLSLWRSFCLEGQMVHALPPLSLECHWEFGAVLPHLGKVPGEAGVPHVP